MQWFRCRGWGQAHENPTVTLPVDNFRDAGLSEGRGKLTLGRRSQLGSGLLPGNPDLFLDKQLILKIKAT